MFYNARARYTYRNSTIPFCYPEESTRHKWIILYRITEYYELSTTKSIIILCKLCSFLNDDSHVSHCVHVDTSFSRAHSNRATNDIRSCQRFRNRVNQNAVSSSGALCYKRRKAANKINTYSFCSTIHSFRHRNIRC